MLKKFLSSKGKGFYLSLASLLCGMLTVVFYTARGGNYLSPVSPVAVVRMVLGIVTTLLCCFKDFGILGILPVAFYAVSVAILLNTEMLFISNVAFGVDGNSFDALFFLFWIFDFLAVILAAVAFSLGYSKKKPAPVKE